MPVKRRERVRDKTWKPLTHLAACRRGALVRKTLLRMRGFQRACLCRSRLCVSGGGSTNWSSTWGFVGFCDGSRSHQQGSRNRLNSMGITMVGGGWERWVLMSAGVRWGTD